MAKARIGKQLWAVTENKVGMLADVSAAVSASGVNIQAICAYGMEDKAHFMLVTDNNQKAMSSLQAQGYEVSEQDVVILGLPNRVGILKETADKLKTAGINLEYIYGTTCCKECDCDTLLVLTSDNNAKVIEVLG
jgi:hypothetical protein